MLVHGHAPDIRQLAEIVRHGHVSRWLIRWSALIPGSTRQSRRPVSVPLQRLAVASHGEREGLEYLAARTNVAAGIRSSPP
jgi:hypothetical protein